MSYLEAGTLILDKLKEEFPDETAEDFSDNDSIYESGLKDLNILLIFDNDEVVEGKGSTQFNGKKFMAIQTWTVFVCGNNFSDVSNLINSVLSTLCGWKIQIGSKSKFLKRVPSDGKPYKRKTGMLYFPISFQVKFNFNSGVLD